MSVRGLSRLPHDFRYAIRQLRNSPGFSGVAIATLALTVGANTAMFSFVNGVLLRPLPYPEADRIVRVLERLPTGQPNGMSTLNYVDFANENAVFEHMAAEAGWRATLTGGNEPVAIQGARVSAHYFDIFGVKAALGRTFVAGDDRPGNDRLDHDARFPLARGHREAQAGRDAREGAGRHGRHRAAFRHRISRVEQRLGSRGGRARRRADQSRTADGGYRPLRCHACRVVDRVREPGKSRAGAWPCPGARDGGSCRPGRRPLAPSTPDA